MELGRHYLLTSCAWSDATTCTSDCTATTRSGPGLHLPAFTSAFACATFAFELERSAEQWLAAELHVTTAIAAAVEPMSFSVAGFDNSAVLPGSRSSDCLQALYSMLP